MLTAGESQALIIGAGIGGLAAAIALRRAEYAVKVLEHAQELREVGAGLTLWPNAVTALRKLGLATAQCERMAAGCAHGRTTAALHGKQP